MQALVIYDNQGNIWNITYGDSVKPESLAAARLEIPDGNQLTGVDLTNPDAPQPVFESIPASDYTNLQSQITDLEGRCQEQMAMAEEDVKSNVDLDYRLSMLELGL